MLKNKAGHAGFIAGGQHVYLDHLAQEEKKRLADLKNQLKLAADPLQKKQLKEAIAQVKAEFKQKRKDSNYSLF